MSSLALHSPGIRPPSQERLGSGLLMAALAHALLIGALAIGLNWKLPSPEVVVAAELWSAVPQVAAPAPVAPPPPPVEEAAAPKRPAPPPVPTAAEREAEIALEKAAQKKKDQALEAERQRKAAEEAARRELEAATLAQQKKLEARRLAEEKAAAAKKEQQAKEDKAKKEAAEQREREAKAQEAQIAKQREENLKRMMGQAAAAGGTGAPNANGNASRDGAPSAAYAGRIKARIKPNILLTTELAGNPVAEVEIRCSPDGGIIGSRIIKPSGNKAWDDIVQRAIDKTGSLPRDTDGRIPSTMVLVFSPRD